MDVTLEFASAITLAQWIAIVATTAAVISALISVKSYRLTKRIASLSIGEAAATSPRWEVYMIDASATWRATGRVYDTYFLF